MSGNTETINATDRAWLEMDSVHNPMVMAGILHLHITMRVQDFAGVLATRLLDHRRFTQVADESTDPPVWRDSSAPDFAYHFRLFSRTAVPNKAALMTSIQQELADGLDRGQPLWRVTLYSGRVGNLIALVQAHHAMADGIAMLHLLSHLADNAPARSTAAVGKHRPHNAHSGPLAPLMDKLDVLNKQLSGATAFIGGRAADQESLGHVILEGGRVLLAITRLLSLPAKHPPCFTGSLSGHRHIAWSEGVDLSSVRAVAHHRDVTINDLLLVALTKTFRQELLDRGSPITPEDTLRVALPVDLREQGEEETGNLFGLVLVELPVGQSRTNTILMQIHEQMRSLKHGAEARAVLLALGIAGQLPEILERGTIGVVADKCVAVVSNLCGSQTELSIGGAELRGLSFFPPQAGQIGIGISMMSYAGRLTLGVSADRHRLTQPDRFVRRLRRNLTSIKA